MDYSKKTCAELNAICKEINIKGYGKKRKDELIEMIKQRHAMPVSASVKVETFDIKISDCFVANELKLSNGNGNGERRLYTGNIDEINEKLTQKPWIIKYSEKYYNEIQPILNNQDNFKIKSPKREENVLKAITAVQGKRIYVISQKGLKDVKRCYIGPQKSDNENVKLWDTFRNTLIPKDYYLELIECDDHYDCQIMNMKTNPPNNNKKNNNVSNTQIDYFKYLEKKLGIKIQGAHNGTEFALRNPENGYHWPVDGIHVCGTNVCSENKDSPCPYNMHVWEFQGDYFHGNPEKYSKDDKFHNVTIKTKWDKDKKKKEYYESQGYKVIIVWESEWTKEKKQLQEEGKPWRIY